MMSTKSAWGPQALLPEESPVASDVLVGDWQG